MSKRVRYLSVLCALLVFVSETEGKGGRSGGGSGRSSGGHSSSSHSSGSSHSSSSGSSHSYGNSHSSSYGNSHSSSYGSGHSTSYGSGHPATYGGEHSSYGNGHSSYGTGSHPKPIGFDHVNQQSHNALYGNAGRPVQHPYHPQTVVHPGGYVHYQPPTKLQYTPPAPSTNVYHTSTHYVPVFQPAVIHTHSDSSTSSFLGGYLVGRLSSGHSSGYHHVTNNYYNDDRDGSNGYYTVHHYHQNRDRVPSKFSVLGDELTECEATTTDQLCVPNTSAFCLKNGTIMCTTPTLLTTPCEQNSTERCVYSRVPCTPSMACNVTAEQTYIDFYLPCIANVTYHNNRLLNYDDYDAEGSYELCVTAIAHPRKLESPFGAVANFVAELGKWHLDQLNDIHNLSTTSVDNNVIT